MFRSTSLTRILLIALLVGAAACAPLHTNGTPASVGTTTFVEVRNDRWDDLTIYLDREGTLFRLGTVPGLATETLDVPSAYLPKGGGVRLIAMRPGSRVVATSVVFNLTDGQRGAWIAARTSGPTGVAIR